MKFFKEKVDLNEIDYSDNLEDLHFPIKVEMELDNNNYKMQPLWKILEDLKKSKEKE